MSFNDLLAKWQQLPSWAVCLGCVSSAERTYPVIDHLASSESARVCRSALDTAWGSLLQSTQPGILRHLLTSIEELPESSTDDSHTPAYLAMRAMSVLAYSLEAQSGKRTPAQALRFSVSALLQLSTDLGGAQLERFETDSLEQVRQELETAAKLDDTVVSAIRKTSLEMGRTYADALARHRAN
jgi:hypothetical protein